MPENRNHNLSAQIKRKVGNDEIIFTATAIAETDEVTTVFSRLNAICADALRDYLANIAPALPHSDSGNGYSESNANWLLVTRVTVTKDKGKRYVKVHGGKYEKYGIVAWPEVWERAGVNPDSFKDGETIPTSRWMMGVITDDKGKPKVIGLKKVEEPKP